MPISAATATSASGISDCFQLSYRQTASMIGAVPPVRTPVKEQKGKRRHTATFSALALTIAVFTGCSASPLPTRNAHGNTATVEGALTGNDAGQFRPCLAGRAPMALSVATPELEILRNRSAVRSSTVTHRISRCSLSLASSLTWPSAGTSSQCPRRLPRPELTIFRRYGQSRRPSAARVTQPHSLQATMAGFSTHPNSSQNGEFRLQRPGRISRSFGRDFGASAVHPRAAIGFPPTSRAALWVRTGSKTSCFVRMG